MLDRGKIVEEGDHAQLLRHGGLYAKLAYRQSGGFLPTGQTKAGTRRNPGSTTLKGCLSIAMTMVLLSLR